MDTLKITYTNEDSKPGVDSHPDNPLARALNRFLRTGKPFRKFSACYFNPLPLDSGIKWFGVFVVSDHGRLIYFPGLSELHPHMQTAQGGGPIKQQAFQVDHLSLEAHRHDWHLTSTGSEDHIGSYPTTDLGEGRVLWFGMSIADPNVLRPLMNQTEVEAQAHPNDSLRRGRIVVQAREDVVFNTVMFNAEHPELVIPSFAHFTVIVGPCGFNFYCGDKLGFPHGSPYVAPPLPSTFSNVPMRAHRVRLEPHLDLDIIATILPGRVRVPATFTSPGK